MKRNLQSLNRHNLNSQVQSGEYEVGDAESIGILRVVKENINYWSRVQDSYPALYMHTPCVRYNSDFVGRRAAQAGRR